MLIGGGVQVLATMLAVAAIGLAFAAPWREAVTYGALAALSSTAVVLKVYADRGVLDSPHGRVVVAVLLFQDLSIVPLVLLFRVLGGADASVTSLELRRETGATVVAIVRRGEAIHTPVPGFAFEAGDTVVLVGDDEALAGARAFFLSPAPGPAAPVTSRRGAASP